MAAPLALECEGSITERGAEGGGEAPWSVDCMASIYQSAFVQLSNYFQI